MTVPSPIITRGPTKDRAHTHAPAPMWIGNIISGMSGLV